jgi:GLPGLI family protein
MTFRNLSFLAATLLTIGTATAQTAAPTSGTLTYETMRRNDVEAIKKRIAANAPAGATLNIDIPETTEGEEHVVFAGTWAKREAQRRGGPPRMIMMRNSGGAGGESGSATGPSPEMMRQMERMRNMKPPVEDTQFTDLTTGKAVQITRVSKDSVTNEFYKTDVVAARPADWEVTGKTKKIMGYACQRATCTIKEQPYTIWFTTELPYTYSPDARFTPDKGVVLWIESDDLMYRATKLTAGPVDAATLAPDPTAKAVKPEELDEVRRKAMAGFRQRSGMQLQLRNRD